MRSFALVGAVVLTALSSPSQAITPLVALRLTPDATIALGVGNTLVSNSDVARHELAADTATLLPIAGLPAAAHVIGYHSRQGEHYLVFDTSVVLGGTTFTPRDVAYTDGSGSWSKYLDGASAGIPDGAVIDALAFGTDAYLRLSFAATVSLGGTSYDPRDIVRYAAGAFSMSAALSAQIPDGLNVVGLDVLPNGHLLLAFNGSGSVGGVSFNDEDVVEFTAPSTWEMAYDGSARDADWAGAGIAALAGEMAPGLVISPPGGLSTAESGSSATLSLRLLTPPTADVTVTLTSSDPTEGTVSPNSLTFTPLNWAAGQTVTVTGVDDAMADGNVAYSILSVATSADAAYNGLAGANVSVTNLDDEPAPAGNLRLTAASQSVSESAGMVTITVSRVGGAAGAVSVGYASAAGTATPPGDFAPVFDTLYWADGDTADKSFTVAIVDDAAVEGDEVFTVTLTDPEGGSSLGVPATQTVTITDNDVPPNPGSLQFSLAGYNVSEGAGVLVVSVSRSGGSDGGVSISYAVSPGTATMPTDFSLADGSLSWGDGDNADKTFTVVLHDDAVAEAQEHLTLTLSNPTGGAALGAQASVLITITDDDASDVQPVPGLGPQALALLTALLTLLAVQTWRTRTTPAPKRVRPPHR